MPKHALSIDTVQSVEPKTYADLIISYLLQIDVEYLFGVPGGAIEPLYNALARNLRNPTKKVQEPSNNISPIRTRNQVDRIYPIVSRHESGAAFMADGYARETGKLGVCCSTTGPGATNLITGVAAAYANRTPMLVITPQIALPDFGKLGFQESSGDALDVVGMFEHCTRYNTLISHENQVECKLYTALVHAFRKPHGPVHISIPMDILRAKVENRKQSYQVAHLFRQPNSVDSAAYDKLVETLSAEKTNVLFIGGGCRSAIDAIINYAEQTNTPMVTTPTGKSLINPYHPLYRGVFGFAGHPSAFECMTTPDLDHVIAIGTTLNEMSTCGWDEVILNEKLIHICSTPDDFARSPMAFLHVLGQVSAVFETLHNDVLAKMGEPYEESKIWNHSYINRSLKEAESPYLPETVKVVDEDKLTSDLVPLKPQRVMYELANRLPKNTRYIVDVGNAWSWAIHYLMLDNVKTMRTEFGFGAMGWAIGAAIGTAFGTKSDEPVVCITGDGSYLMSGQELTVAIAEKLPVIFIILNDQALGMIKHGQRLAGAEQIGYEIPPVDFAMVARGLGAQAFTITTPEDFMKIDTEKLLSTDGPTLIDVKIDPDEIPPMGARIKTLNKSSDHGVI